MKTYRVILIVFVIIGLPTFLFAGEQDFLILIEKELLNNGWTPSEAEAFTLNARQYGWEEADRDFCEMIAHSLVLCRENGGKLTAHEEAALAFHLAVTAKEMKQYGFREQQIIRISFNTSRDVVSEVRNAGEHMDEEVLEAVIREQIRKQLCKEGVDGKMKGLMKKLREGEDKKQMHRHRGTDTGRPDFIQ
ncbi:MAG: hypothetical protein JW881_19840 [Spirochaetales bacterium]|nr:hypothetical protein [Spirochaetales bacterium]